MGIFSKTATRAAALAKYYFPFKWYNLPSIESPINAVHLNHIEDGINEMDNRILILHQDKADRAEIANVFMDFTMDDKTGVMTFTRFDGTTVTHDSAVEKIALNCYLEGDNFVLELADGTKQKVSLAKFIDTYTFSSTDTIRMTVNGKNIAADIPDGKITLAKLEPTVMSTMRQYLLDAETAKGVAEQAASTAQGWAIGGIGFEGNNAKEYAGKAQRYAVGGVEEGDTTDNARYYCEQAEISAEEAKQAAGCDGTAASISAVDEQGMWIKTVSGTGTITVDDAAGTKLAGLEISGQSVQGVNPSTENPQEIASTGDGGNVTVSITGKNLFNKASIYPYSATPMEIKQTENGIRIANTEARTYTSAAAKVKLKPNTTYTLSGDITKTKGKSTIGIRTSTNGGGSYSATLIANLKTTTSPQSDLKTSFVTDKNEYYAISLFCTYDVEELGETVFENIQLEEGETQTAWEPYYESQSVTIPLTEPLYGIGDYHDKIACKNGIWGIERIFTSIVFDGSTDENWYTTDTSVEGKTRYGYRLSGKMADKSNPTALCSHFALTQRGATASGITGFAINDVMLIYYDGRPLEEFKTWLAANPITVVYQPVDPTWEPFSADIQTTLNAITTYQGRTTIAVTADGPAAEISMKYYGQAGNSTTVQNLLDALASKVVNDLVSNTEFTEKLTGYMLKSQLVNNLLATVTGNPLDATQGKALKDQIDVLNSNLSRSQLIATQSTTETDIKNFIIATIKNGQRSFGIATILNNENTAFFGEAGNFIVTITGDTANYGFIAENLWNGKLWTGRFAIYTDDWYMTDYAKSSDLLTNIYTIQQIINRYLIDYQSLGTLHFSVADGNLYVSVNEGIYVGQVALTRIK
ncbi:hypothetical protein [Clostridium sp. AM58-1XD]|uniref:hypothetical protein n=1 Tax=Clostridium sp. AM58-1XD TaxID=2292307 RepID=UPI000E4D547B|nr:hypothetical protein [Clostridium sp. AM58-1XD]RGY95165.1 hypothetical protein DXA13_19760 [Clostridium sp. AM58-1XD]